jgi:sugar O-acyltransferase (sialic acid O-acetyltransferase NeuD family)
MKNIIIVGAGGFGREILYLIKDINKINPTWNIKGFIDDNASALNNIKCDYKIIGSINEYEPDRADFFAIGIANPKTKEKIINNLKSKDAKFATLISPYAYISGYVELGEGCIIFPMSTIGDCAKIGNFVHVAGSMIGQDSIIGDYSTTTGYSNIVSATLGKRVFVGSHAVILNERKIGDDAFICAGSIVFHHVKPGVKVFGYPARKKNI